MVNDIVLSRYTENPPLYCAGAQRGIKNGPLYPPEEVIAMATNADSIRPSTRKCLKDMQSLGLDNSSLATLVIMAVQVGCYRGSMWCKLKERSIAACDEYVVVDSTWSEAASKELDCTFYIKFAISRTGKLLLLVSCHLST